MKIMYSLLHFHTLLSQGKTKAADRKCFIKEVVLKTVYKSHKKSPVQRLSLRARG